MIEGKLAAPKVGTVGTAGVVAGRALLLAVALGTGGRRAVLARARGVISIHGASVRVERPTRLVQPRLDELPRDAVLRLD